MPPLPPLRPHLRTTLLTLSTLLTFAPIALAFNEHVAQLMWVSGPSMYPFLNTDYSSSPRKDVVLVRMWKPWAGLRRGMVVALWSPYHPENMIVKRIVAVPGDEVRTKRPYPLERAVVPAGHVWVEGEHPEDRKSLDSNTYGPVAISLVAGQVKAVVWPWAKAGGIRWQDYRGNARVLEGRHAVEEVYVPDVPTGRGGRAVMGPTVGSIERGAR